MTIFDLIADALPLTGKTNSDLTLIFGFCAAALRARGVYSSDEAIHAALDVALAAGRVGEAAAKRKPS